MINRTNGIHQYASSYAPSENKKKRTLHFFLLPACIFKCSGKLPECLSVNYAVVIKKVREVALFSSLLQRGLANLQIKLCAIKGKVARSQKRKRAYGVILWVSSFTVVRLKHHKDRLVSVVDVWTKTLVFSGDVFVSIQVFTEWLFAIVFQRVLVMFLFIRVWRKNVWFNILEVLLDVC